MKTITSVFLLEKGTNRQGTLNDPKKLILRQFLQVGLGCEKYPIFPLSRDRGWISLFIPFLELGDSWIKILQTWNPMSSVQSSERQIMWAMMNIGTANVFLRVYISNNSQEGEANSFQKIIALLSFSHIQPQWCLQLHTHFYLPFLWWRIWQWQYFTA